MEEDNVSVKYINVIKIMYKEHMSQLKTNTGLPETLVVDKGMKVRAENKCRKNSIHVY